MPNKPLLLKPFFCLSLLLFGQLVFNNVRAQNIPFPQKDISDVLFGSKKQKATLQNDSLVPRKFYNSFLPIPGYNPALGFVIGGGISTSFLSGQSASTRRSNILANASNPKP